MNRSTATGCANDRRPRLHLSILAVLLSSCQKVFTERRMNHEALTRCIIGRAFRVHAGLGTGFVESTYKKALQLELEEAGIRVEREVRLEVRYRHWLVGEHYADMVVDGKIIVEAKALATIAPVNEVQLVNYLTATRIEDGLLLNFGAPRLQVRRKFRTFRPRANLRA